MKRSFRVVVVGGVMLCMVLFVGVSAALAADLTNTQISFGSFFEGACGGVSAELLSPFTFNGGIDGTIASGVWLGCETGGSTGLMYYIYQISHSVLSSEQMIHGISMKWQNLVGYDFPASPAGTETSFWIDGSGNKSPNTAIMNPSTADGTLTWNFFHDTGNHILPGENSVIFGAVSPAPPGTVFANLLNAGQETEAQVLVPVPEPASMLLLSSGLLGLAGLKAGRRRKTKAPAVA